MKRRWGMALLACCVGAGALAETLEQNFDAPPDEAQPQTWWHWVDGRISKAGITAELEAIKGIGLGGVQLFVAGHDRTPTNETPCLSGKWKDAVRHAASECERLGLDLTAQIAPGWSGAGGPWITPDRAMFLVECQEARASGGETVTLAAPPSWPEKGDRFYRDIAVLAFPTPPAVLASRPLPEPSVTASFPCDRLALLNRREVSRDLYGKNKDAGTVVVETKEPRADWILFSFPEPVTVRCVTLASSGGCIEPDAHRPLVESSLDGVTFRPVVELSTFACHYNCELDDVDHAIPATSARHFRLVWQGRHGVRLTRVGFSSRPVVSGLKGKTGENGLTFVDEPPLADEADDAVDPATIVDLTARRDAKGDLVWTAPAGEWTVLRVGYRSKTRRNMPAPQEGSGLECDKFDAAVASFHFDQYMGVILGEAKACGSKAVKGVLLDSWEAETQNWTHQYPAAFKARRGYEVTPWLPAYAGYIVKSRDLTDRFLRDARQTCNDLLMENFFDVIRRRARENGLTFAAESVGGSGAGTMVADAVEHYLHVDIPMTEAGRPMREAVSAAHLAGRPLVAMEAHTSRAAWDTSPRTLKAEEDFFFSVGVNRIVFHTYAHNPQPDRLFPGPAFWSYGTTFSRGQTWWPMGKPWISYLSRCQYLLQRGQAVADVLACYGESTLGPLVKTYRKAESGGGYRDGLDGLPEGYEYDLLPAAFLKDALAVRPDGTVGGPGGSSYRLLALARSERMTPETLRKVAALVESGITVLGPRPCASPSLSGYPACDDEVRRIAAGLWGDCDGAAVRERACGKGRVLCGMSLEEALARLSIPPDFKVQAQDANAAVGYIHRRDGDAEIYFVRPSRGTLHPDRDRMGFRVTGKVPEIWNPMTGERTVARAYTQEGGMTWLPFDLGAPGVSGFVVFRTPTAVARGPAERNFPRYEPRQDLGGPWTLSFKGLAAPEALTLPKLSDLSTSDAEAVKYFSGVISYRHAFVWRGPAEGAYRLSLGTLATAAEVTLNGTFCGTVWCSPNEVSLTGALKSGDNTLEIRVANTWVNRLIGDARLPEAQRITWTTYTGVKEGSDVGGYRSGLIGPVTIREAK